MHGDDFLRGRRRSSPANRSRGTATAATPATKTEYADTTHEFEQRIAALEQQLEKQKTATEKPKKSDTVRALELAAEEAAKKAVDDAWARYQGHLPSEPTYEYLSEADQEIKALQEHLSNFEFHGYFRSGYGLNGVGGQQAQPAHAAESGED